MNMVTFAILFACFVACFGEKVRYDNYRVYSIEIENERQFENLRRFESGLDGISFLKPPTGNIHQKVEMIVSPHKFAYIHELFKSMNLKNRIKIDNLQKLIDEEQPQNLERSGFGWKQYYDLQSIYGWLDELLEKFPNVLTNYNYGTSYENRTLRAIKVSYKKGNPTIFIESTIHAREWITQATTTYILNELLTSSDTEIRQLADNYDWIFVPVVNVDGYAFTHSNDRMWRKTRQPYSKVCIGADPNRNFDFHHAEVGASNSPCAETYAGPKPFSEPEILALAEFIKSFDNIKLYISFHSYSQLLLFPYGHTYDHAPNHSDMKQIGLKAKEALAQRFETHYTVGNIAETIYLASGSSIDWVYGTQNVSLTYTFEFRDKGRYGFILPATQIIPNSLEVIDGLKALVNEAESLQYL